VADDGSADPRLAAALAADDGSPATRAEVLAALAGARLFVPVRAVSTREEASTTTGLRQESSAEMQLVLLQGRSGTALPAFPDGHEVQRWQPQARPVPLPGPQACRAALDQGATALLLDPTGVAFAVTAAELPALAEGRVPVAGTGLSSRTAEAVLTTPDRVDPQLAAALSAALRDEPVRAARLLQGPDGLVLGVAPATPLDPAALAALAARVLARAGAALPPAGVDLTVVAPAGPGHDLLAPRRGWLRRGR
jgi:hypothetical protein